MSLRERLVTAINAGTDLSERAHHKLAPTSNSSFEVTFSGFSFQNGRLDDKCTVLIWGGPDANPNAEGRLEAACRKVMDVLYDQDCLLVDEEFVRLAPDQVEGGSVFTHAAIMVRGTPAMESSDG